MAKKATDKHDKATDKNYKATKKGKKGSLAVGLAVTATVVGVYFGTASGSAPSDANTGVTSAAPFLSGYVPEYRLQHVKDNIESFGKVLDEIILFSVYPGVDGSIKDDPGMPLSELKFAKVAKQHNVNTVLLSIGGAGRSSYFHNVVRKEERRQKLVASIVDLCTKYGLDGIDIDWEIPQLTEEKKGLAALLKELQEAFAPKKLKLTLALHFWDHQGKLLHQYVDRINFMTYDFQGTDDGHHSFYGTRETIVSLIEGGVPPSKICMGIPVYARSSNDVKTYSELLDMDPKMSPDKNRYKGFGFNGRTLCKKKAQLAKELGLGCVFVWEVGQDVVDRSKSLLGALHEELRM
eukprot:TRINITY_DN6165_c0_g1_i1.p1 TRINITY_DN6165_c0_g1~~TRINITY_DN6165_c0_g1_i1.p1  ORF type:complete len:357 (+),score=98.57 TRINITY_DN6165_c0_g1_i1:23-1072(+)